MEPQIKPINSVLTAHLSKFNYSNRSDPISKIVIDNNANVNEWSFWNNLFLNSPVNFYKIKENKQMTANEFNLIHPTLFYEIILQFANLSATNYKDANWYDSIKPLSLTTGNAPVFQNDPIFAQKVIINNPAAKILMIGDIHSSFHSVGDIIIKNRTMFKGDTLVLKENSYIIFLGDIIDRGPYSMELLYFVFLLKLSNNNNIYIINGNHENYDQWGNSKQKNFLLQELENSKFKSPLGCKKVTTKIHETECKEIVYTSLDNNLKLLKHCLYYLPSVIYLNFNNKWYHLSHGAFDSNYIPLIVKFKTSEFTLLFIDYDSEGCMEQFKWGDLAQTTRFGQMRMQREHGIEEISSYLERVGLECIISGHQDIVPLGLIIPTDKINDNNFVQINNQKFIHWQDTNITKSDPQKWYDFYLPQHFFENADINSIPALMPNEYHIKLVPHNDFLALVTSTATVSKSLFVSYNTYLVMEAKPQQGGYIKSSDRKSIYYYKYFKYKSKYLKKSTF